MKTDLLIGLLMLPVNAVVLFMLLPFVLARYFLSCLSLLVSVGALLQYEDRRSALRFSTAYSSDTVLKARFPNSIAVRSWNSGCNVSLGQTITSVVILTLCIDYQSMFYWYGGANIFSLQLTPSTNCCAKSFFLLCKQLCTSPFPCM